MKYLIQGLFSLVLLGFVYTEPGSTGKPMTTNDRDSISTPNSTDYQNSSSQNPYSSGSPTSGDPNAVTGAPDKPGTGAAGLTGKTTMTTKSGESHIVTCVGLLFASAILHTLWQ